MANPIKLALLAALALTLAWGGMELLRDNRESAQLAFEVEAEQPLAAISLEPKRMPPISDYDAIIDRPLFFADRTLPAGDTDANGGDAGEQAVTSTQSRPPNMRLSAIVVENDQRIALVEIPGNERGRSLEVGQSLSGWRVTEIEDTAIVMESGTRRQRFPLLQFETPPDPNQPPQRPRIPRPPGPGE